MKKFQHNIAQINSALNGVTSRAQQISEHVDDIERHKDKGDLVLIHVSYMEVAIGQLKNSLEHLVQEIRKGERTL